MSEFFNIFEIDDDVEIYYFYYWPLQYDHLGSSYKQLSEINYESKVIFWVAMDSVIDRKTYNFYEDSSLISIQKFEEICKNMRVGPASGDFINYSSSEAINLVSWLVESQLMGNLKFWIGNGTLLETGLNDPISKLIYVSFIIKLLIFYYIVIKK